MDQHVDMTAAPLQWEARRRMLGELTPLQDNPFGRITQEKRRRLEQKLLSLGTFEAATVDNDDVLLTFNKRYDLLIGLYGPEHEVEVMHPSRLLTSDERKQIILTSNVNEGEWISEILNEQYSELLDGIGIDLAKADQALAADVAAAARVEKPEYPIVARMSEQYDSFVIVATNAIDSNHIAELLQLQTHQSYKSQDVGMTHVITASQFSELWKSRS